jgi:hypothetical protein
MTKESKWKKKTVTYSFALPLPRFFFSSIFFSLLMIIYAVSGTKREKKKDFISF